MPPFYASSRWAGTRAIQERFSRPGPAAPGPSNTPQTHDEAILSPRTRLLLALAAGAAPASLVAQASTPPAERPADEAQPAPVSDDSEDSAGDEEEIVVTGARQRGAVLGDIPAEVSFSGRQVRALGAGTLAEVLEAISPQTRSGRGRGEGQPVILLNGQRISGFSEIRDIPPEAIVRIDVFPEEVALKYGYRADQRVVNFVLRRRFRAITTQVEGGASTAGGRETFGPDVSYLKIGAKGRLNLAGEYDHNEPLLESERGIVQANPAPGVDLGRYRTLLPQTDAVTLNGTVNRRLSETMAATLNARLEAQNSHALLGLPRPALTPPALERETQTRNGHAGLAVNGAARPWQWSVTGNYDRNTSDTTTDTATGSDRGKSLSQVGSLELVANAPVAELPAGAVSTTLRAGFDLRGLESETLRSGIIQTSNLSRRRGTGQINVDVPIASKRRGAWGALGNMSANMNVEIEQLSDFGTLRTLGAGLNWSPLDAVNLRVSWTDEDGAPSMEQLGGPVLSTAGVRVFDFVRGETVEVTRTDGGNRNLGADNRRVWSLGANLRPPIGDRLDFNLSANYTASRTENPISAFPAATAQVEAAFPERFTRDSSGRLSAIDTRPVNFARNKSSLLRWGFNLGIPLGPPPPQGGFGGRFGQRGGGARQGGQAASGQAASGQPGARPAEPQSGQPPVRGEGVQGGPAQRGESGAPAGPNGRGAGPRGPGGGGAGGRGGFGGFGGPGGGRSGRIQLSLYHTWRLVDETLIAPGLPVLDFLGGSPAGNRGGRPRHELEFQGGVFKNGLGARLTANWQSSTFVRGGTGSGLASTSGDLFFSNYSTVNLRLFADLGLQPFAREHPFLRGTRITLAIDNLLDTRQQVRDSSGATPLTYQPGYIDPVGRSFRLSIRKLFF
jgi:hypothetical protein